MSYPKLFGEYELLEFDFDTEKGFDDSIELLNKIFTPNPNFWQSKQDIWLHIGENRLMIPMLIGSGDIKIYKYTFKEPMEPTEEDRFVCYSLKDLGRIKSANTFQLYWRAYNFFKEKGFYIKRNRMKTYLDLTLDKFKSIGSEYSRYDILDDIDTVECNELGDLNTFIRCGEIEGNKLLEFANKNNYLWVFPFIYTDDYDSDKIPCYLFEFTDRYEKIKMEEMKRAFNHFNKNR